MHSFFQVLCLSCVVLVNAQLLYPKIREKLIPDNVEMPEISSLDIEEAFNYARNQTQKKFDIEQNFFVLGGHIPSQTEFSTGRRLLVSIPNSTLEQNLVQEQLEYATLYLEEKYKLTKNQTRFGLSNLKLPEDEPIVQKCQELLKVECNETDKYRTPDGSCNNLRYPNWGKAGQWYGVMMGQDFGNGISTPRESARANCSLPDARVLSGHNLDMNVPSKFFSLMTVAWGQFVAHDLGLVSSVTIDGKFVTCCPLNTSAPYPPNCFPIQVPKDDYFYSQFGLECMDFQRSAATSYDCKLGTPRRPINQQTGFLDASVIYGKNQEEVKKLRSFEEGGLKTQNTKYGHLLPKSEDPKYDQCSMDNLTCFQSGDPRVNSQPALTTMHTILARFHDIVAHTLATDNPSLSDEILYQESRKIVSAIVQAITYKEFLRDVLGKTLLKFYKLNVRKRGYTEYDPNVDPSVTTEFATGAFRFGHSLVQNDYDEVGRNGYKNGKLVLKNNYFYPEYLYKGQMDSLLRGLVRQKSQELDNNFAFGVGNHVFEVRGKGYGFDLVAVGIQRGRDTGMPSYTSQLEYFYNISIQSFADLGIVMTEKSWKELEKFYGPSCVENVDIYMGGFIERHIAGGLLGPTFAAVVGYQFQNLKYGDRFYFEHRNQVGSFTKGQLREIRKMSMAYLICVASNDIDFITPDAFQIPGEKNKMTSCKKIIARGPRFSEWFDKDK